LSIDEHIPKGLSEAPVVLYAGPRRERRARRNNPLARGEPMVWLMGGATAVCVLMIVGLLAFITFNGFSTFWPAPLVQAKLNSGETILGEPTRHEMFKTETGASVGRTLYKTGNYDTTGRDFTWVRDDEVVEKSLPQWGMVIERIAWQNAYGILEGLIHEAQTISDSAKAWEKFQELRGPIQEKLDEIRVIEKHEIGDVARKQDDIRIELRGLERELGKESREYQEALKELQPTLDILDKELAALREKTEKIRAEISKTRLLVRTPGGALVPADRAKPDEPMFAWQVVRAYPANQLDSGGKTGVYFGRWREYLLDDPREANTEGGVWPAIFGTVMLTFIMILFVVPIGVIASIYLREYAKQGPLLSIVRISVNNLAGVPSIVFGVFGLGFFCYLVGGSIDQWFFPDRLPDPTVGKSAMIWASLTLALLTLPVIIVATEEALAAVPRSMREGSYACGASKWQTIRRIVLPRAMPGIMTGMILAIARGAGEVAPLMLVGAVKLAPELPISGEAPFFGTNRSFMHLGFHIYDLGFQSRNSEAARSMVFTTTFLLISVVVLLNLAAMFIRMRLRKSYLGSQF
jgi:phosphate transport system permease protein